MGYLKLHIMKGRGWYKILPTFSIVALPKLPKKQASISLGEVSKDGILCAVEDDDL